MNVFAPRVRICISWGADNMMAPASKLSMTASITRDHNFGYIRGFGGGVVWSSVFEENIRSLYANCATSISFCM